MAFVFSNPASPQPIPDAGFLCIGTCICCMGNNHNSGNRMRSPQDIARMRQEEREKLTPEQRQLKALEDIADTLESLRVSVVGAIQMQAASNSRQSGYKP